MFLHFVIATVVLKLAAAATTSATPTILYDEKHHKAMIVSSQGCYEYHMNHKDMLDYQNAATRPTLEARMLSELAMAVNIQETGHHHIDHMTQEIQTACASLPVYSWDIPVVSTMPPVVST